MARKKQPDGLTPLELELMKILWDGGASTVQRVLEMLPEDRALAYTTVQTMLNVLHRKGKVHRELRDRAYVYTPAVSRAQAVKQAMGDIIDRLFGGSPERLVMSLVETKHLTPERLQRLSEKVDEAGGRRRGKS